MNKATILVFRIPKIQLTNFVFTWGVEFKTRSPGAEFKRSDYFPLGTQKYLFTGMLYKVYLSGLALTLTFQYCWRTNSKGTVSFAANIFFFFFLFSQHRTVERRCEILSAKQPVFFCAENKRSPKCRCVQYWHFVSQFLDYNCIERFNYHNNGYYCAGGPQPWLPINKADMMSGYASCT